MSWFKRKRQELHEKAEAKRQQNELEQHGATPGMGGGSAQLNRDYYTQQKAYNKGRTKALEKQAERRGMASVEQPQQGNSTFNRFTAPVSSRGQRTKNAAVSGLNFLNGDMGMGGGNFGALENMFDFGGSSSKPAPKPKGKRTTITTGGKRITISDTNPELQGPNKKKQNNILDNLDEVMNKDWDF